MLRVFIILSIFLGSLVYSNNASAQNLMQQEMLIKINEVRAEGCNCSGRFMQPVPPLIWSPRY